MARRVLAPAVASLCATATRAHDAEAFPLYVRRTADAAMCSWGWGIGLVPPPGAAVGRRGPDAWPCSAQDPLPETGVTFQTSDAALQGLYVHGDTQ